MARQSVVGEESSWDFETFSAIADQMPEDCAVFSQRDPAAVLTNVLCYAYARLVDEDAGTANFDSPLFCGWLSLLKELQDAPPPESESSEEALLQSADQAVYYNEDVTNIVLEETAPFFDGAISQDEAIGRIQNRVQLYLEEQQ